jgi:hypothetical protein
MRRHFFRFFIRVSFLLVGLALALHETDLEKNNTKKTCMNELPPIFFMMDSNSPLVGSCS